MVMHVINFHHVIWSNFASLCFAFALLPSPFHAHPIWDTISFSLFCIFKFVVHKLQLTSGWYCKYGHFIKSYSKMRTSWCKCFEGTTEYIFDKMRIKHNSMGFITPLSYYYCVYLDKNIRKTKFFFEFFLFHKRCACVNSVCFCHMQSD